MGTKKAARKASKMQMAFSKFPKFSKIQAKNGMPFGKSVPSEFKLVGALVLMLAILYVFQLISTPSFLKSQTQAITGLVVSDTAQQEQTTQPQQQTATTSPSSPVTKKETKQAAQTSTAPVQAAPTGPVIKIVEPQKDSTLSPGFTVNVQLTRDAFICYYLTKDDGSVTWDRRMRPCRTEFMVEPGYCKTAGKGTCYVYVEASDQNGNILGKDSAYYSIK